MNEWSNWKRERDRSVLARYRRWWKEFPFTTIMIHTVIGGVLVFLFTLKSYRGGEITWFWPAFGLGVATLACFALFIPAADNDVR